MTFHCCEETSTPGLKSTISTALAETANARNNASDTTSLEIVFIT